MHFSNSLILNIQLVINCLTEASKLVAKYSDYTSTKNWMEACRILDHIRNSIFLIYCAFTFPRFQADVFALAKATRVH